MTVGVCIFTLNAEHHLPHCLPPLITSPLHPEVLIVDSSSNDNTVEIAKQFGVKTVIIPRAEFNHGTTREWARRQMKTDITVMVTQDAYACDNSVLNSLIQPILKNQAAAAYARQIPHENASFFESFHREFNYPPVSEIRSAQDIPRLGSLAFFCSNSFAAYNNSALDSIGGFQKVVFGEDSLAAAQLLLHSHSIAYVAEALVCHSHNYTLSQEFRRHVDIGKSRKEHQKIFGNIQSDQARGKTYARTLLSRLIKEAPHHIPYACLLLAAKWMGYQFGKVNIF